MRNTVFKFVLFAIVVLAVAVGYYNLSYEPLPENVKADRIVVQKSIRELTLFKGTTPLKSYRIALGSEPVGKKQFSGDHKTPEGIYRIYGHNKHSRFYGSLRIAYPDSTDRAVALDAGKEPGGDIMIHGIRNGLGFIGPLHRLIDWTDGCIAVTNAELDEIWRAVPDGTPIEILP